MSVFCSVLSKLSRAVTQGAFVVLLACNGEQQFPTYSPAGGNPALLTAVDIAVYEAVIAGYANAGQILMLPPPPGPPPGTPIPDLDIERPTAPRVRMRPYTSKGVEVAPQPDRWWTLDRKRIGRLIVPPSAVEDFNVRNRRRASLKTFRPTSLRIEWSDAAGTLNCLYSVTLPGYSRSKDEAVVEISCGTWALAGGGELLYLRRTGGTWRVVAKQRTWIS
ncbi:MAG: hypothetical protein ACYC7A_20760 [Thermoanaerobaculia bacterium]